MRILVLNSDYRSFLDWLYSTHPELESTSFGTQLAARNATFFGVADSYSWHLRQLGHEAWDIHVNNEHMQRAWAAGHGIVVAQSTRASRQLRHRRLRFRRALAATPLRKLKRWLRPLVDRIETSQAVDYDILEAQIRHFRPDVLLNQAVDTISPEFLRKIRCHAGLIVGQVAAPIPHEIDSNIDRSSYDLMLSSLPNFVQKFKERGISAEVHLLAFDARVNEIVPSTERNVPVSFVGSLSPHHSARINLLEKLAESSPLQLWGPGLESLARNSRLRVRYQGTAWGVEMYKVLRRSKITINHHIGIASQYANNMRLYEATGMGSLLITDWKSNIGELFEPYKEIVCYSSFEECVQLVDYFLRHEHERASIAEAGQRRTLTEHAYAKRIKDLADCLERYLNQ